MSPGTIGFTGHNLICSMMTDKKTRWAGICRGMSAAGRIKTKEGQPQVFTHEVYPGSRLPDLTVPNFNPAWIAVGQCMGENGIELGMVSIGLDDVMILRKNLSCALT